MAIEIRTVFCDDIRHEDNGKLILIGVYTADLVPAQLPGNFPLSLWLDIRGLAVGSYDVIIGIDIPMGAHLSIKGGIEVNDPTQPATMIATGIPINIASAGTIVVSIEMAGEKIPAGNLVVRLPRKP